ncbi:hypothetical protein BDW59DRAFT_163121 [Aspergillus cavernicola]|uniref:Uncharacterized protein n=1 Tax=Aspergillus cavernicola TaxID=176166 RepID=A0ABR4I9L6_9EURO
MPSLRKTNPELFGTVFTGPLKLNPKNAIRLVADLSRYFDKAGCKTYEISTGLRVDEGAWRACVRFLEPKSSGWGWKRSMKQKVEIYIANVDEFEIGGPRDLEYLGPWSTDVANGMWKWFTRIIVYKGIPLVTHRNGHVNWEDWKAYDTLSTCDRRGLDGLLVKLGG